MTEEITAPLCPEDTVIQPEIFVSPPKWHLGHTTWFFDNFILKKFEKNYEIYHPQFNFLFNSYYESQGPKILRENRHFLNRPPLEEVLDYRKVIERRICRLLQEQGHDVELCKLVRLGMEHEQQHQELLLMDIKYIFWKSPVWPSYPATYDENKLRVENTQGWTNMEAGVAQIGYDGDGFSFDNEKGRHDVLLQSHSIQNSLVTNGDYLKFIDDGGYERFEFWHDDGWRWLQLNKINMPLYWFWQDNDWSVFTLNGRKLLDRTSPVSHISYYEAHAYAKWAGARLPTEFEWENAADILNWGDRWEWTSSAYAPYPGFVEEEGALGEYNGKFMVNQQVLRGACSWTPKGHSRRTYRNFYHPDMRWMLSGIRLVK